MHISIQWQHIVSYMFAGLALFFYTMGDHATAAYMMASAAWAKPVVVMEGGE